MIKDTYNLIKISNYIHSNNIWYENEDNINNKYYEINLQETNINIIKENIINYCRSENKIIMNIKELFILYISNFNKLYILLDILIKEDIKYLDRNNISLWYILFQYNEYYIIKYLIKYLEHDDLIIKDRFGRFILTNFFNNINNSIQIQILELILPLITIEDLRQKDEVNNSSCYYLFYNLDNYYKIEAIKLILPLLKKEKEKNSINNSILNYIIYKKNENNNNGNHINTFVSSSSSTINNETNINTTSSISFSSFFTSLFSSIFSPDCTTCPTTSSSSSLELTSSSNLYFSLSNSTYFSFTLYSRTILISKKIFQILYHKCMVGFEIFRLIFQLLDKKGIVINIGENSFINFCFRLMYSINTSGVYREEAVIFLLPYIRKEIFENRNKIIYIVARI